MIRELSSHGSKVAADLRSKVPSPVVGQLAGGGRFFAETLLYRR